MLGYKHLKVALTMNNMVLLHADKGEFGKAAELFEEVLVILEETLGEDHEMLSPFLENFADSLDK